MYILKNGYVLQIETGEFVLQDVYIEEHQIKLMGDQLHIEGGTPYTVDELLSFVPSEEENSATCRNY